MSKVKSTLRSSDPSIFLNSIPMTHIVLSSGLHTNSTKVTFQYAQKHICSSIKSSTLTFYCFPWVLGTTVDSRVRVWWTHFSPGFLPGFGSWTRRGRPCRNQISLHISVTLKSVSAQALWMLCARYYQGSSYQWCDSAWATHHSRCCFSVGALASNTI